MCVSTVGVWTVRPLRAKRFGGDWIVDTGFRTQWCHFIWILGLLYFQDDVFVGRGDGNKDEPSASAAGHGRREWDG